MSCFYYGTLNICMRDTKPYFRIDSEGWAFWIPCWEKLDFHSKKVLRL